MPLLDFLKKKKQIDKAKKSAKKPAKTLVKTEIQERPVIKAGEFEYEAIREPHVSEKGSMLAENNQYVFEVSDRYNKPEIKKAIEGIYGVNVLSVNIVKIPAKKRRLGRTEGFRKAYKKAIIKIKDGQKIEIL